MNMNQIPQPELATRMVGRLRELLVAKDFEYAEALTATVAVGIGLWWLLPFDTFNIPAFIVMQRQAPEWLWGAIVLLLGIAQVWALLYDHLGGRRRCCMALAVFYGVIAAEVASASLASTNIVFFIAFSLSALWAYWRMGLLARQQSRL